MVVGKCPRGKAHYCAKPRVKQPITHGNPLSVSPLTERDTPLPEWDTPLACGARPLARRTAHIHNETACARATRGRGVVNHDLGRHPMGAYAPPGRIIQRWCLARSAAGVQLGGIIRGNGTRWKKH